MTVSTSQSTSERLDLEIEEFKRFRIPPVLRNARILVGGSIFLILIIFAVAAPLVAPYDPDAPDFGGAREGPSWAHPLGQDQIGRDLLSRSIYGTRTALFVGGLVVVIAVSIGVTVGTIAGLAGGWVDRVIGALVDATFAFPMLVLALAVTAALGPSLTSVLIAIGATAWPTVSRIVRGSVLKVKARDFILAARASGASSFRVAVRHVIPNIIPEIIVIASLLSASAVLAEASLSFLGLGAQPPTASWGLGVAEGRPFLEHQPWISLVPGAFVFITVMSLNVIGDGLRDVLDPRLRHR